MTHATGQAGLPKLDTSSLEALTELEQNTPDAVKKLRAYERLSIRCKVIAEPGNASDRLTMKVQGVTGDLSPGGCQVLFPLPIGVGDIYRLAFDRTVIDLAPVFARCMRCRVVRDDAYEAGFSFFSSIDLGAASQSGPSEQQRAIA